MNVFEYLSEYSNNSVIKDEKGNVYLYEVIGLFSLIDIFNFLKNYAEQCGEYYFIQKEIADQLSAVQIDIDSDVKDWDATSRRPYYRMRGKKVTEEQAFEIIKGTDSGLSHNKGYGSTHMLNFRNNLIDYNYGWIHRNGVVGINACTGKYPDVHEFIADAFHLAVKYPYLKVIIAISNWNEIPNKWWELDDYEELEYSDYTAEFLDAIQIGVEISDGRIHVLNRENAIEKYKEYEKLYQEENTDIYVLDYYNDNNIQQLSKDDVDKLKSSLDVLEHKC